jgi:hypothetical protein
MRYDMSDAPELTRLLLSVFTKMPQPAIEKSLQRYLWRLIRFDYAEQLAHALDDVRSGATGDFLYHKASGLIFAHVESGYHRLLLAHLCALAQDRFFSRARGMERAPVRVHRTAQTACR